MPIMKRFLLIVAIPAIIGELSLTFWLLLKGVNIKHCERRVAQAQNADKWLDFLLF